MFCFFFLLKWEGSYNLPNTRNYACSEQKSSTKTMIQESWPLWLFDYQHCYNCQLTTENSDCKATSTSGTSRGEDQNYNKVFVPIKWYHSVSIKNPYNYMDSTIFGVCLPCSSTSVEC